MSQNNATTYTPGPWVVQYNDQTGLPRAIKDANGEHVTYIDGSRYADDLRRDPEAEANARLIAAAPVMREALHELRGLLLGERTAGRSALDRKIALLRVIDEALEAAPIDEEPGVGGMY